MNPTHFASLYPAETRSHEIEQILRFIKEGNSCQLIGLPGVGKSNVLDLLTYNHAVREKHLQENQKWFHFILVNFSEVRQKPLSEVIKFLFLELIESLTERRMEEEYNMVQSLFKDALHYLDELVLFQGFKKAIDYLAIEKEYTVVFLFDRFEKYIPSLTTEFFSDLRVLRNRAKYRFSCVFSLNRPLESTLEPLLLADFYEFVAGHITYLPLYDKPGLTFRMSYLEMTGKTLVKKNYDEVITLTAGHGKLTRLCIETFISQKKDSEAAITEQSFLANKTVQGGLLELWYFLTPEEQTMINTAMKGKQPIDDMFLESIGLLRDTHISIPLFETFLQEKAIATTISHEDILYHADTNTITRGGVTLSERLTVSEFRLLRFILENQGKILERDSLITAVWQEAASTAGVTDQALDQLIFRLRKKIEEDPNNPRHIQTVKGRGIKFTA